MAEPKFRSDIPVHWVQRCGNDRTIAHAAWVLHPEADPGEGKNTPADWERVIRAMVKGRHGCYDSKTEVLTDEGWKPWPSVRGNEAFLTLDLKSDQIEWQKAERLVRKTVSEPMVRIRMQQADLLVTQDHNMLAAPRVHSGSEEYRLLPAREFRERSHRIRMGGGRWEGRDAKEALPMKLMGFFIGDGWYGGKLQIEFHLKKDRKIEFLTHAAVSAGWKLKTQRADRNKHTVDIPECARALFADCYTEAGDKQIPDGLLELPRENLEDLFDGLMASDGHVSATGRMSYSTTSEKLAGQMQELAVKIGLAATVRPDQFGTNHFGEKPRWMVSIYRERNARPKIGWTAESRSEQVTFEHYEGDVHCVTVPNGTLYVRRNGIPCWCGNTPFEHGLMTVYVEAPVVVWWEWTRHRFMSLGCPDLGFSLESGRYKVLDGEFYLPPEDRPMAEPEGFRPLRPVLAGVDPDRHRRVTDELRNAAKSAWASYERLVDDGIAREVARLVLPFNIYYAGYVSASPRTWLQFFSLRRSHEDAAAATFPQWEIQKADERCEEIFARYWPITYRLFNELGRVAPGA